MPSTPSSAPSEARRPRRGLIAVGAAIVVVAVGGLTAWAVASGSHTHRSGSGNVAPVSSAPTAFTAPGAPTGGAPAPPFALRTLDGHPVTLAQLAGRPVVVNFWASWCNDCRHEFPLLAAALRRHRATGLEIVGVTFQDIASDARAFAKQQHAGWILASDPDGMVADAYRVRGIPQTIFIRRDGTISSRLSGITSGRELEGDLGRILA